ncbi:MAG: HipA domain-containing protein [Actinomycetota bacterium]|nr:HipA domain-containing protein [Actinomycetota bacterium]
MQTHGDAAITPWLWGLLPENADVLSRWGREFGVSSSSPFGLLGTQVGLDCAGAVQFCPPDRADDVVLRGSSSEVLTEADVADRLRRLSRDSTAWLGPGNTGQFSLAGAQAKTALRWSGGAWHLPSEGMATTHVLKPAIAGLEAQDLNEHLCLAAARWLGLEAAVSRVETFEDQTAIVVERYDRREVDGVTVRVHQEDLCQALSVLPGSKYHRAGGPSAEQVADALVDHVAAGSAVKVDVRRFADALMYNWLIGGTDARAKNYSLVLTASDVRLAPLCDVASFLPYDTTGGRKVSMAMKVGGDDRLDRPGERRRWARLAGDLGLTADALLNRAAVLAARVPAAFEQVGQDSQVAGLKSEMPERLARLIADRAAACLRALS